MHAFAWVDMLAMMCNWRSGTDTVLWLLRTAPKARWSHLSWIASCEAARDPFESGMKPKVGVCFALP